MTPPNLTAIPSRDAGVTTPGRPKAEQAREPKPRRQRQGRNEPMENIDMRRWDAHFSS